MDIYEYIPLPGRQQALILYEDKNVIVIDKPVGWILAPRHWKNTSRNLQRSIEIAIQTRQAWVKKRNLRFLRYVHRLDAETSGILILARNRLALTRFTQLFSHGKIRKLYLAVVLGVAPETWQCTLPISVCMAPQPHVKVGKSDGKPASTNFARIATYESPDGMTCSVIAAEPSTGRMHQIRAHLAATGFPVLGDPLYSNRRPESRPAHRVSPDFPLALRAVGLAYSDPIRRVPCRITTDASAFLAAFKAPKPVIELAENVVKNWPTNSSGDLNSAASQCDPQTVHNGPSCTNP